MVNSLMIMLSKNEKSLNKMLEMFSMVKLGKFNEENQICLGWVNLSLMITCFFVFVYVLIEHIVENYND